MAMSLTVMLGILGLAVDVGWAYWRKMACKTAAQAAAMAAVKEASVPYSAQSSISCASLSSGPLYIGCEYASANGFTDGSGKQSVKMAAGTSSVPVAGVMGVSYWVSATASEQEPQWFTAVLGSSALAPAATATAAVLSVGGGCIYALGTTGNDITLTGAATLTSGCGLYVNSTSTTSGVTNAVYMNGSSKITTSGGTKTNIVGGYTFSPVSGGPSISPSPVTGAAAATDPVGPNLPAAPTAGSCQAFTIPTYGTYVLPSGTYCSAITIGGSVTVQMSGTYYIENGITVTASGSLQETAPVTLYMEGP
jgi:hypothetical protein